MPFKARPNGPPAGLRKNEEGGSTLTPALAARDSTHLFLGHKANRVRIATLDPCTVQPLEDLAERVPHQTLSKKLIILLNFL